MSLPANTPEVEVSSKPTRRRFTAEYKRKILNEAAGCSERGAIGALLRREGLYSSHLIAWREAAERGELAALTSKKRGPRAKIVDARDRPEDRRTGTVERPFGEAIGARRRDDHYPKKSCAALGDRLNIVTSIPVDVADRLAIDLLSGDEPRDERANVGETDLLHLAVAQHG
jgi:transposase-like protein